MLRGVPFLYHAHSGVILHQNGVGEVAEELLAPEVPP